MPIRKPAICITKLALFYNTYSWSSTSELTHTYSIFSTHHNLFWHHYSYVIMSAMASQITSVSIVCPTLGSGAELRVTGSCVGNSLVTSEFSAQKASNAENVYIWWLHHDGSCWALQTTFDPTPGIPQEHDSTPRRLSSVYPRQATHVLFTKKWTRRVRMQTQ